MVQYVYLLQEREFIKTGEKIYKIGRTEKENHKRFNQYPKGSNLLFQRICGNCKTMEKRIIELFKEKFVLRKDIGNEYFEGDYNDMINVINGVLSEEDIQIDDKIKQTPVYTVTTYEEWMKGNIIKNVIVTTKNGKGFIRYEHDLWIELYDTNSVNFDARYMGYLKQFIKDNKPDIIKIIEPVSKIVTIDEFEEMTGEYKYIDVEFDDNKIFKDVIKKCYTKKINFYKLAYHEYVLPVMYDHRECLYEKALFNAVDFTYTDIDEIISDKILMGTNSGYNVALVKNKINISIVDEILDSLITNKTKIQFKNLMYNLIVEQTEKKIVFYDYDICLLTVWANNLLNLISSDKFIVDLSNSSDYILDFWKSRLIHKSRCVVISKHIDKKTNELVTVETQIKYFRSNGIKNIIVCQRDAGKKMYDIENFNKYLNNNREKLMRLFEEENECKITAKDYPYYDIYFDDDIFSKKRLLCTNFLKWCCTK